MPCLLGLRVCSGTEIKQYKSWMRIKSQNFWCHVTRTKYLIIIISLLIIYFIYYIEQHNQKWWCLQVLLDGLYSIWHSTEIEQGKRGTWDSVLSLYSNEIMYYFYVWPIRRNLYDSCWKVTLKINGQSFIFIV